MKFKISTLALVAIISGQVSAQNTFPSTGNVGIGTTTPTTPFNVVGQGSAQSAHSIRFDAYSGAVAGASPTPNTAAWTAPGFNLAKARGTKAAPLTAVQGDRLAFVQCFPYDGTTNQATAQFYFIADGPVAAGSVPTSMIIQTGGNATNRADRLVVSSAGRVGINVSSQSTARLYVLDSTDYYAIYGQTAKTGTTDRYGVYGLATTSAPGYGIGVAGEGNYMGGSFYNNASSYGGTAYGVYGTSYGTAGTRYGVYGYAYNSGVSAVGVYGTASGATNNWAGYFAGQTFVGTPPTSPTAQGTLHVENNPTTPTACTGYFNSTYVGNQDTRGVYANAVNNPGWGYGGQFTGGYRGVYAIATGGNYTSGIYNYFQADGAGTGARYGVYAYATGSTGVAGTGVTTANYGVYSAAAVYGTAYYAPSDKRLKTDIQPLTNSLDKIMAIKTYTYKYKHDTELEKAMNLPENEQIGFLAQELEAVIPQAVANIPAEIGHNTPQREDDRTEWFKGIQPDFLLPVVVNAMQEQQAVIVKQNETITQLQSEIAAIKAALSQSGINLPNTQGGVNTPNRTELFQNVPNPFDNTTTIPYYIADGVSSAKIIVTNAATGQVVETQTLATKGNGQVRISAAGLANGTYTYSLVVDGQIVSSKAMVLAK